MQEIGGLSELGIEVCCHMALTLIFILTATLLQAYNHTHKHPFLAPYMKKAGPCKHNFLTKFFRLHADEEDDDNDDDNQFVGT